MTANFNLEWEIVDGLRAVMQVANHNYYRIDNQRLAGNAISNSAAPTRSGARPTVSARRAYLELTDRRTVPSPTEYY